MLLLLLLLLLPPLPILLATAVVLVAAAAAADDDDDDHDHDSYSAMFCLKLTVNGWYMYVVVCRFMMSELCLTCCCGRPSLLI